MVLAILGLFKICKPTYAKIYHCLCQKKKKLTGLVQTFCQLKQKRKFILHYYIIENTSFSIQDSWNNISSNRSLLLLWRRKTRQETYQSKNVVLWSDNCGKNKNCSASLSSESKYGEWGKSFSSWKCVIYTSWNVAWILAPITTFHSFHLQYFAQLLPLVISRNRFF